MRGEELILRFFAFHVQGLSSYKTPQKHWLNDAAKLGKKYDEKRINELEAVWKGTIMKSLIMFDPSECFRRLPLQKPKVVINRALMDLTLTSLARVPDELVAGARPEFRQRYMAVLEDSEFADLITRAIDHKKRTLRRFEIWDEKVMQGLF
jgi:hypothetical protein